MVGRGYTSAYLAEISGDIITPRMLVTAEFTGGTVHIWDGIGDLSYGGNTFSGVGEMLGISDVVESTEIRIESLTITFSGITTAYKSLALQSVDVKNLVTIQFALLNSNGTVLGDPDTVFIGTMDSVRLTEGAGRAVFELEVQNELVFTQKIKERRHTGYDQKADYPSDTFCDHAINADKETRWGSTSG